jgi:hypothetical protein
MLLPLCILAIYSLSHIIRNLSGPYNILGATRNKLLSNKYIGVFFYDLLTCPWCIGFHCGYIIYALQCTDFSFKLLIIWGLAGSFIVALIDALYAKITN